MENLALIKQQKMGIFLHRTVYVIFLLSSIFSRYESNSKDSRNFTFFVVFLVISWICEEILYHADYFHKENVIRYFRYLQCIFSITMLCFLRLDDIINISIVILLVMFVVDYFLTMNMMDKNSLSSYMSYIALPIAIFLMFRILSLDLNTWILVVFNISVILLIIFYEAKALIAYVDNLERRMFTQQNEITDMQKKNQEIIEIQNKLQETNYELNTQKNDLKNANKQIREANEEIKAQTDVLHYIALSFDVNNISNQITDAIMNLKNLTFCAVYIREDVYRNKRANCVVKSNDDRLAERLNINLQDIYREMIDRDQTEALYHEDLRLEFPYLKDFGLKTIYMKILGLDNETYGLFMIGDKRYKLFDEKMSFYDAIIAQYDIAISNAKVYNDMQYMAQKDGLTGINNRIHFNELFNQEALRVTNNNACVSVALFDIDKFKNVNDTYGHLAGDEVIKRIATVTEQYIETYDGFVCRYGGEEFVVVLPDRSLEVATAIIEELFEKLCQQVIYFNEYTIPMSVSVGLTNYPEVCKNTDELLKRADWCMYYAKEHGRHQLKVDDGSIQRD
ncbi:MAG: diguanylate cyclase [Lachnospiraceae bacterium]